jgi:hypothetical protein
VRGLLFLGHPMAALKTQLLRVIIRFCDRDGPNRLLKEQLLSRAERDYLRSCEELWGLMDVTARGLSFEEGP